MRPRHRVLRVAKGRTGSEKGQEASVQRSEIKVHRRGDQLEMPKRLGEVSSPAFTAHCVGSVSLRVVSEPPYTHPLTGSPGWGPRNLHLQLPGEFRHTWSFENAGLSSSLGPSQTQLKQLDPPRESAALGRTRVLMTGRGQSSRSAQPCAPRCWCCG